MMLRWKLVFTAIGATLAALAVLAIVTETHTGYTRFMGLQTARGEDAIWVGKTLLLVAIAPCAVWLPARWVGPGLAAWWLALMAWLFVPFFLR